MAQRKKRRMRLPNGIGSVHKIGDGKNRRRPWRARVPSHVEFNAEEGRCTQKYIVIGYYATEAEAIAALFDYRKDPYTLEAATSTFADVYASWSAKRFPDLNKVSIASYKTAFTHSAPLHNIKMRDIRASHMEKIMDSIEHGFQTQIKLKSLWNQLFKFAMERDIVQKNYAKFVKTRDQQEETKRTAIQPEDLAKLWQAIDAHDPNAELAMIYIYTGLRATELPEIKKENVDLAARMMIGGKKTAAGKGRRIPIHSCILPFITRLMEDPGQYLVPSPQKMDAPLSYSALRSLWVDLMEQLNMSYTLHYARHTFATMLREANIEEDLRKLLIGHANGDITDRYTHHPDYMLLEAIDKLPGRVCIK